MFQTLRKSWQEADQRIAQKKEEAAREQQNLERAIAETIFTISADAWARTRMKDLTQYDPLCVDANVTGCDDTPVHYTGKRTLYEQAQELGAEAVVDVRICMMRARDSGVYTYTTFYFLGTALVPKQKPMP